MALLRKLTFNNSLFTTIALVIVIAIMVTLIGYMFGKFAWYLSH